MFVVNQLTSNNLWLSSEMYIEPARMAKIGFESFYSKTFSLFIFRDIKKWWFFNSIFLYVGPMGHLFFVKLLMDL